MIPQFEGLQQEEIDLMYDSIPMITLLIGGADGNLDQDEQQWAVKITKIRSYTYEDAMKDFYLELGERYQGRLSHMVENYPKDTEQRGQAISNDLSGLNAVLPKLDLEFAASFYKDLRSFATHVAKASGGFLRFGSISNAEKQWLELPMLTPIEIEQEEGEQEAE